MRTVQPGIYNPSPPLRAGLGLEHVRVETDTGCSAIARLYSELAPPSGLMLLAGCRPTLLAEFDADVVARREAATAAGVRRSHASSQ